MPDLNTKLSDRKNQLANPPAPAKPTTLAKMLQEVDIRSRFEDVLGNRAGGFLSSVLSVVNGSQALKEADPMSIIGAAAIAASLDLPINPNLSFAAIVPYRKNGKPVAQFQMMARGYVQLGIRSGQYLAMNTAALYEGEFQSWDRVTGQLIYDLSKRSSDVVVGYAAYFKMVNGYEKFLYMPVADIQAHGKKYSKSYSDERGQWQTEFDRMAQKTVLKQLLSHWGILSVDMQRGIAADQAVRYGASMDPDGFEYPDNASSGDSGATYVSTTATVTDDSSPDPAPTDAEVLAPTDADPGTPPPAPDRPSPTTASTPSEWYLRLEKQGYPTKGLEHILKVVGKGSPLSKWTEGQQEAMALISQSVLEGLDHGMVSEDIQDALSSLLTVPKAWNRAAVDQLHHGLQAVFGSGEEAPPDGDPDPV